MQMVRSQERLLLNKTLNNMSNLFCHQCGNKLPSNAKFCTKCGKAVEVDEKEKNELPSNDKESLSTAKADKKRQNSIIDGLGIFFAIVVVGVIILVAVNSGSNTTTSDQNAQSTTTSRVFYIQTDNTRIHDCASLSCNVQGYY